jgi:hypothetical protein
MGYFDPRTGTWNEGMPPGMESLDLATEYARPLNIAFHEAYSTPYSNYPDPNIAVPKEAIPLSQVNEYRVSRGMNPITQGQYDTPGGVMGGYANDSPQISTQPLSNLVKPQQKFVPPTSDAERQQQAYDYRMSQPKTANYVRNNTTGAVQDLPSYQPQQSRPAGQVSGAQATGDMVNNLISLGQRQNIPRDQLAAMVQYQASAQPGSPSAEDLYRQSFQYGTPVKDLIAAHSAIGSGSAAREKDQLGLMKTRAEIANLTAKPTSEYDKKIAEFRAQRDILGAMTPEERQKDAAKRAGIVLKPGEIYNETTGQVSISPNSTAGRKLQGEAIATRKGLTAVEDQIDRVGMLAKDLLADKNLERAVGWWDALTPVWLATSPQGKTDVRSSIENLQELLQTKGLTELRASGVAPGSITEKEWTKFSAMIANIDPRLSEDAFKKELGRVLSNVAAGKQNVAETRRQEQIRFGDNWDRGGNSAPPPDAAPSVPIKVTSLNEAMKLKSGTRFIDPNGVERVRP